jgi:hypothetical protein
MTERKHQKKALELLREIPLNIDLPICSILSFALDIPELFDLSDQYLCEKLDEYANTLQFNERMYEDNEEEDTY